MDTIIVEPCRLRVQMPLADDSRLIPRLPQALSHVRVVGIQRVLQRIHPILLAVLPRKNRSPAGRTDRVGHEAILEYRAFMGDAGWCYSVPTAAPYQFHAAGYNVGFIDGHVARYRAELNGNEWNKGYYRVNW